MYWTYTGDAATDLYSPAREGCGPGVMSWPAMPRCALLIGNGKTSSAAPRPAGFRTRNAAMRVA